MQCSGVPVAEHGTGGVPKDRCHPAAATADRRVTDGIDAAMNPMQPAGRDPALDRPPSEPYFDELPVADDAVLSSSERGELQVG